MTHGLRHFSSVAKPRITKMIKWPEHVLGVVMAACALVIAVIALICR